MWQLEKGKKPEKVVKKGRRERQDETRRDETRREIGLDDVLTNLLKYWLPVLTPVSPSGNWVFRGFPPSATGRPAS